MGAGSATIRGKLAQRNWIRLALLVVVALLLAPVVSASMQNPGGNASVAADAETQANVTSANVTGSEQADRNVTFVTTQGGSAQIYKHAGAAVAVDTDTKEVLWKNDKYRRYMDIDPIGQNEVLFAAGQRYENSTVMRYAVRVNWRTGEELERFWVPGDTHDLDYLGDQRYVVADKVNHRAYIYNATTESIVWQYKFEEHFSSSAGAKDDYTHLNDVDVVDNGTAILMSPRNFDRVFLVDIETKETRWVLGEEDNYDVLYEQHNPVLLQQDPATVLVADSENDRVIEYQRTNDSWEQQWSYGQGLIWPRDADRLPNGNTLITDTANDRILEVTPEGNVTWEYATGRGPYDAERLRWGDEAQGAPTNPTLSGDTQSTEDAGIVVGTVRSTFEESYKLVGAWVLPPGTGKSEFGKVLAALALVVAWSGSEIALRVRSV